MTEYMVVNNWEIFGDRCDKFYSSEEEAEKVALEMAEAVADWFIKNHEPISEEEAQAKCHTGYASEIEFIKRWETVTDIDRETLVKDILDHGIEIVVDEEDDS